MLNLPPLIYLISQGIFWATEFAYAEEGNCMKSNCVSSRAGILNSFMRCRLAGHILILLAVLFCAASILAPAVLAQADTSGSQPGEQDKGPDDGCGGPPPGGMRDGPPPGGSSCCTLSGAYTVDGGIPKTESDKTYTSDAKDVSAIMVTNGGTLTLVNPAITTSGNCSSVENSKWNVTSDSCLTSLTLSGEISGAGYSQYHRKRPHRLL
jgi:hypothetical protein